jgi:serine/threonine protein phosphatase PrpC
LGAVDREDALARAGEHVVRVYGGVSKKGYAPYNPRKRNQDSMVMEEHKPTGSLLFAVFDGHGEAGDLVSHYFAERVPPRVFASPKWAGDVGGALVDEIDRLEKMLLAGT